MLRFYKQLLSLSGQRFLGYVGYCTKIPKGAQKQRFQRSRTQQRHFKPNVGLRHALNALQEDEGKQATSKLEAEDFVDDDEMEYDQEILKADVSFDQYCQEEEIRRKNILFNTIKRKYFKSPPEPTLLTWAAKEQLRYLYEMDPKTWTPEKLANSFPISEEGVKKLLKSKYHPETQERIIKHDQSVLRNWKQLKLGEGPIATAIGQQLQNGKLNFETLDGDKALPMPTEKWKQTYLPQSSTNLTQRNSPPGEFESLITDYIGMSSKTVPKCSKEPLCLVGGELDNHVEDFSVHIVKTNSPKPVSFEEFKEQMRRNLMKESGRSPQMYEKYQSWLESNVVRKVPGYKTEMQINGRQEESQGRFDDIQDFLEGKIVKYKEDLSLPDLKWDVHRDVKNPKGKEAYLFEEGRGYQRPYGRYQETDGIEIKADLKQSGKLYRKGDCYYDENGELLYRVPYSSKDPLD